MAGSFFTDDTRQLTTEAIREIEGQTAAEIVVTVHHQSGRYLDADLIFGAVIGLATLMAILYLPQPFEVATIPLEVLIMGALGAFVCSRSHTLRRLLTSRARRRAATEAAAKATFYDLGISRTTGRTGVLIYVSTLERQAVMIPDVGVPTQALGQAWVDAQASLQMAIEGGSADAAAFLDALRALGPLLAGPLPRQEDDVNELSDEVVGR